MKFGNIIIAGILTAGCYGKAPEPLKTGLEGKLMPEIRLLTADSVTMISTRVITTDKPTILFAFEPWCPYCRAQTRAIIKNIEKLKGINIYMLCTSNYSEFKKFYNKYKLNKYRNIKAGIDYMYSFPKYFKTQSVPYIAVYGTDKKLNQVFQGKNYISTLKHAALN